jgi:hypothetical protein
MNAKPPLAIKTGLVLVLLLLLAISLRVAGKGVGRRVEDRPQTQAGSQPLPAVVVERLKRIEAPLQSLEGDAPASPRAAEPLYTASAMRDPLQSLLPPEESVAMSTMMEATAPTPHAPQPPVVALQGVFWGGAQPTAIINGQVYGVGDTVSGATIRVINRRGIELEFQGTTYLMTMQGTMTMLSQELSWR